MMHSEIIELAKTFNEIVINKDFAEKLKNHNYINNVSKIAFYGGEKEGLSIFIEGERIYLNQKSFDKALIDYIKNNPELKEKINGE